MSNRPVQPLGAAEGSGPVAVFMGTSLTEGWGLADPATEAWPALIGDRARAAGLPVRIRNSGMVGETSAGALRRVRWLLSGVTPDVFVLESGANDGLRGLPPQQMLENLDGVFARVRDEAPDARLVVVAMEAPPNLGPEYVEGFRAVFPELARRWDAVLVPFLLEGVAGVAALNQADRIHPTPRGHVRMADNAWPTLEPVLRAAVAADENGASAAR